MAEQLRGGDEVSYFFSGNEYPFRRGPKLKEWSRDGVAMLEVTNSRLFDHGRQPELEIREPQAEALFAQALSRVRPDVVHVHELAGLPSSLLDVASKTSPVVMTLHDYFLLCPTFKLLDACNRTCRTEELGHDCVAAVSADPRAPGLLYEATFGHLAMRHPAMPWMRPELRAKLVRRLSVLVGAAAASRAQRTYAVTPPSAEAFRERRKVNLQRLNRVDRLVAVSRRVSEIYAELGATATPISVAPPTLSHIEHLRPRGAARTGRVTFATLGGGESVAKGARVLSEAVAQLATKVPAREFRLLVFGHVGRDVRSRLAASPSVELCGPYPPQRLGSLLEAVDVGIVPSIWEEAYGLAGVEFLAKAIPVIGNAIGGIVDYTRDGETGWVNQSCSSSELATIMANLVREPSQIDELSAGLRANRDEIIKPMSVHAGDMRHIYDVTMRAAAERRTTDRG